MLGEFFSWLGSDVNGRAVVIYIYIERARAGGSGYCVGEVTVRKKYIDLVVNYW